MKELEKLQDDIPAAPFNQVKPTIENEIGKIENKFDSLDEVAISGASLGQVYVAKISGKEVVVKVKRPGIEKTIEKDLKVLKKMMPMAMKFIDKNLEFSAKAIVSQFIETIHEEMDYKLESSNLKKIKNNLKNNDQVIIPSVFDDYTSTNVITMEYLPGTKITNIQELDKKGIDRQKVLIEVYKIFYTMMLRNAIFHADPHPGNISVNDDGKIILYDFGMVGRLDEATRLRLIRLYLGLIEKDPQRTVNAMDQLGMLTPDYNQNVIEKAILLSIKQMHGQDPSEMEVKAFTELANRTMGRFPFLLPKELALYLRMTSIIEGMYKIHKADFKFAKIFKNILEKENLVYEAYWEELKFSFDKFKKSIEASVSLGSDLREFLEKNESIMFSDKKNKTNTLLSGSIFSAAIFIGSAFIYSSNEFVGIAGMVSSLVVMGIFAKFRN